MILIADSGSTKCTWILDSPGETRRICTIGINAIQHTREQIRSVLEQLPALGGVESVYFYGAGCGPALPEASEKLRSELGSKFPKADVHVESDLQAAALALYGRGEGIACILGTGANSCHCRRGEILQNVPPLGYVLGDEGSGAVLGEEIIRRVYREPYANRFLASFAPFILAHTDRPEIRGMVAASFRDFARRNLSRYPAGLPVSFVGGIAGHFAQLLRETLASEGYQVEKIVESPAEGLLEYHHGEK